MISAAKGSVAASFTAFSRWLDKHPLPSDRVYGPESVRYQVARYCDYLDANPWTGGDPLRDAVARDGAVAAYGLYLDMFGTPPGAIHPILASVEHFYIFLGLGTTASGPAHAKPPVSPRKRG